LDSLVQGQRGLVALLARASVTGTWNLPWAVSQQEATERATGVVQWGMIEPRDPRACRMR
jgi:hypothetical protein